MTEPLSAPISLWAQTPFPTSCCSFCENIWHFSCTQHRVPPNHSASSPVGTALLFRSLLAVLVDTSYFLKAPLFCNSCPSPDGPQGPSLTPLLPTSSQPHWRAALVLWLQCPDRKHRPRGTCLNLECDGSAPDQVYFGAR
uniref:Uncharacterized protein n=1 Tax=Myotis myotis TaxID=51298 RepID=A0A7J7Z4Q6_MYOMY|nr:hypothetical protein mMyoMyo1_010431 [Myotis myotis]